MRYRFSSAVAVAGGVALAVVLLSGCDTGADTRNGVIPGPPLPSGVTLEPGVAHFQPATPILRPTEKK
jgi:hypothetical protein